MERESRKIYAFSLDDSFIFVLRILFVDFIPFLLNFLSFELLEKKRKTENWTRNRILRTKRRERKENHRERESQRERERVEREQMEKEICSSIKSSFEMILISCHPLSFSILFSLNLVLELLVWSHRSFAILLLSLSFWGSKSPSPESNNYLFLVDVAGNEKGNKVMNKMT